MVDVDREIELLKIQLFAEQTHARFTTVVTTTYAIVVGFSVVFLALLLGNLFPLGGFAVALTTLLGASAIQVYRVRRNYAKALREISLMVEAVREGEELPELERLFKGWRTSIG